MDQLLEEKVIPERLRQALSLILTIVAVLLYAAILGSAIVRTIIEDDPTFTPGAVRAAGLLAGLVGSVVTAGFARSWRLGSVPISASHPMAGQTPTAWVSLGPPSLAKSKLSGLARTLGLLPSSATPMRSVPGEPEEAAAKSTPIALWIALLYFAVYFLVGICAFALSILRPTVPELVDQAAWVWLGTVISSGYSFFALDTRG